MKRPQSWLTLSVVMGGLFMLAFIAAVLVSSPADFLYANTAGLATARQVGQLAAIITGIGLFVTAAIMAVSFAFQTGTFVQHVIKVIPLVTLAMVLAVLGMVAMNIGTVGTLLRVGTTQLTLTPFLLLVCVALATVAVGVAGMRVPLTAQALRLTSITGLVTAVVGLIAAALLVLSVVIVATNEPSASFGPPGGAPPQGGGNGAAVQPRQGAPNGTSVAAAGTPTGEATPEVGTPSQGGQPPNQGGGGVPPPGGAGGPGQGGPNQGGDNDGAGGPPAGGFPGGGPGGNMTEFKGPFTGAGVLAAVFAVVMLISAGGGMNALRRTEPVASVASAPVVNYGRDAGSVLGAFAAVSVVVFLGIQLIPVKKDNPPVVTEVQWDSPQTQQLWERACADCHSNETKWPWYSSFAPASWIQAVHINDAREEFNISDTSSVPAFLKSMFPNNAKMNMERGTMPPADYTLLHPDARLSDTEKEQLATGLANSLK